MRQQRRTGIFCIQNYLSHTGSAEPGSAEHKLGDFKIVIAELVLGAPSGTVALEREYVLSCGIDADDLALLLELYDAVNDGEEGVVPAACHVDARFVLRAALADEY